MSEIITAVQAVVPNEDDREAIYRPIYREFRDNDWDTVDECLGVDTAFDRVVRAEDPRWFADEDEEDEPDDSYAAQHEGQTAEDEAIEGYLDGTSGDEK